METTTSHTAPTHAPVEFVKSSASDRASWVLFGLSSSLGLFAASATATFIWAEQNGGMFDALAVLFTGPLGFFIGVIVATAVAFVAERKDPSPEGTRKRTRTTFIASMSPSVLLLLVLAPSIAKELLGF